MKTIQEMIIEKKNEFLCGEYVFGFRGDDQEFSVGDDCFNSSDPAGEDLRGTCSLHITENMTDEEIRSWIKEAKNYGQNVYLICGDDWGTGEDRNERVIYNAEILAII